jgi:hypothetical protein
MPNKEEQTINCSLNHPGVSLEKTQEIHSPWQNTSAMAY